jgi:DNA-nicking Smr family endonuclease
MPPLRPGGFPKKKLFFISEDTVKTKQNFGDILDQWDKESPGAQGKKDAGESRDNSRPEEGAAQRRRRLHLKKPDAVIDIHGLTRDEAWSALEQFFADGKNQGFEKLLIIHGKGNHSEGEAVLKRSTGEFIERCPFAGESGHGNAASGGNGATWVLLKGGF